MSPKTKEQNSLIKDERREQILSAALNLFARRGLVATKISDIAAMAHLSHGLVYHYFESKEQIFTELVSIAVSQAAEGVRQIASLPLEPLDKIRTIAEYVVQSIFKNEGSALYFLLMIQATVSDVNPIEVKEILSKSFAPTEIMIEIVEEGQRLGSIAKGNAVDYVVLYWAAIEGLALYRISMGENFKVPNIDILMKLF